MSEKAYAPIFSQILIGGRPNGTITYGEAKAILKENQESIRRLTLEKEAAEAVIQKG